LARARSNSKKILLTGVTRRPGLLTHVAGSCRLDDHPDYVVNYFVSTIVSI
jgi:hypothetical protein